MKLTSSGDGPTPPGPIELRRHHRDGAHGCQGMQGSDKHLSPMANSKVGPSCDNWTCGVPMCPARALAALLASPYTAGMNIPLSAEEIAWLERKVAGGQFASLEEAAAAAIRDSMASELDDLAWAKPLVEDARASIARGEFLTHDQFRQFLADERSKLG